MMNGDSNCRLEHLLAVKVLIIDDVQIFKN